MSRRELSQATPIGRIGAIIALCFFFAATAAADISKQDARFAKLPSGEDVSPAAALEGMARALGKTNAAGFAEWKDVPDGPGDTKEPVLRLATRNVPEKPWLFQATAKITDGVKKGDVLLAVFHARGEYLPNETAECVFVFEQAKEPHRKSAGFRVEVEKEWRKFYVPFLAAENYAPGEAQVNFQAGFGPQIIQLAGLRVINYGGKVRYGDLPYTPLTYKGRSPNAEWRAEAEERINKYRKALLTVRVHNLKGRSVPGAEVRIRQVRHAYGFGSAVAAEQLLGEGPDSDQYRSIVESSFNKVTLENDLKMEPWEKHRERALDAVAWLEERKIALRGHTLLWPGWKYLPPGTETLAANPEKLRNRLLDHIRDIVGTLKGKCTDWDVVNEPYSNTDVQKVLGESFLADVFRITRDLDPKARLFVNDYGILSHGGTDTEHQDAYFKTIQTLKAAGPISGIGMQGHFDEQLTPPVKIWEILDRFSVFGIPIHITEHDLNVWDEEAWADYTRDLMTACFAHPATSAFITWGFWEGRHWIPNAAFWTKDWQPRPAAKVWQELVFKKWWTNSRQWADGRGRVKTKGFLGDYIVEVKYGTMKTEKEVTLKRGGTYIEVELRPTPKVPPPVPGTPGAAPTTPATPAPAGVPVIQAKPSQ